MTDDSAQESYTHGYSEEILQLLGTRTAAVDASFFIPHLSAGMAVLDCGCGPGSITVDLAEIVAPGQVVGVDIAEDQLADARSLAAQRGITNVSFEGGNIYDLRFPDHTFDAVFANHVIEHLSDPVRALKEVRRVLKLGGLVGMCNDDWSSLLFEPATPLRRKLSTCSCGSPSITAEICAAGAITAATCERPALFEPKDTDG